MQKGVGHEPHDAPEYAASKAAVMRLTSALSNTLLQRNVKMNTICLGWVDTPASRQTREGMNTSEIPETILSTDDIAKKVMDFIHDRRTGRILVWKEDEDPYNMT
ncbi:SDR family NAD(P)-dependent oxidoreductase [Halobacillus shinanisalinarum]|uniref:SDR family NAD(P)-dependent oxidoreductase n=1 Tax=Halobacillus shinanisalinarum TaxID=2932258 RepID=A0ABY4H9V8_9BACI|nr:SDR family NAD(P)-dependent oxidoreductase [Halobacillus shinanisalinarum]UOQ95782.1 SDR family NAD(P)-dependent oxidoreductase [Halobacillus shinanisalinarum]